MMNEEKKDNVTPSESSQAPAAPAAQPAPQPAPQADDAKPQAAEAPTDPTKITNEQLQAKCLDACKNVFDPEIPVNIFELGLIYDVAVDEKRDVKVTMTLTSPACPAAQELPLEVRGRIAVIPGVNDVEVDVVFDPPWSPAKMSEAAKVQLGFDL